MSSNKKNKDNYDKDNYDKDNYFGENKDFFIFPKISKENFCKLKLESPFKVSKFKFLIKKIGPSDNEIIIVEQSI